MALRVHVVRKPDPEHSEMLLNLLKGTADVSFGPQVPRDTVVLVEGQLKEEHLAGAPLVEHVVIPFAGLQAGTREVMAKHPVIRLHNIHHNAAMTAEMAMALLLACARRIVRLHNGFSYDDWEPRYFSRDALSLSGKTVVILGFGAIGQRVGRACEAFGMDVVGVRSQSDGRVRGVSELRELLPKADFLVVTLPLTEQTEGLVGKEEIALLPPHGVVVNVGRGKVIDEEALFTALKERRIDSAGLDVWYRYPRSSDDKVPPSDFPFASLPNVVMTPHVGGATRDAEAERIKEVAALVRRIAAGEADANLVGVARGY